MYRSFFGLRERPFDLTPNPRFLVLTAAHKEALSTLEYGIASRRGITALIGEAGTGKTTLIRSALERQSQQVHCVYLHNPSLTRAEFVEMLALHFHLSTEAGQSKTALLTELEAILRSRHDRGESSVLVVDEAQSLPLELLEEIRLLGNIETDETKLLSIVLAGQPELATRLNQDVLRQLKQRIALRCELRPLEQAETAAYLAGRLRAAGGVGAQIFTREAVMMIHERSHGVPRTASVIADNALLTAFALGQKPINSVVIAEVCRDLDLQPAKLVASEPVGATEGPPKPRQEPPARSSRVLTFDSAESDAGVKERTATPEREPDQGMFTGLFRKRRRFSIF